jgi:DNA-binding transcriptional ArsR family regulator
MKNKLKAESCSRYLKSLADPERLKIIERLQSGPQTVSELATALKTELANVSHHLSVLRSSRLVCTLRKGKHVQYSLNPKLFSRENDAGDALNFGCCQVVLRGRGLEKRT